MTKDLLDKSVVYVTGKGGVGKTTVAASLGLAAARRGRRTIVCEVGSSDRLFRAFARQGVGEEEEVELAENLWAITIDPQTALQDWVVKQLGSGVGSMSKTLLRSNAFQYFVAAAPGAKELITIAKVWELSQSERWTKRPNTYDTVIVDAPASGHGIAMLQTPRTFGDIARVGPIKRQAGKIEALITDPERIAYVAVALPEEMPVNETLELQDKLEAMVGVSLDAIVVNALLPVRFDPDEAARLSGLAATDGHDPAAAGALRAALDEYERARGQRSHLRRLRRGAAGDVLTLPFVYEPEVGMSSYETLADVLEEGMLHARTAASDGVDDRPDAGLESTDDEV